MSGEDRRKQLIDVAIDLFSKKGFGGTTTREIAAAAGVAEAIIFRHFATKQDLYSAILDYRGSASGTEAWIAAAQQSMDCDDDEGLFRLIVRKILEVHRTEPRFERLMIHAALEGHELAAMHHDQIHEAFGARFTDYIRRRQEAGALCGCDPSAIRYSIAGAAQFYAMRKYVYQYSQEDVSDEQMIDALVNILMTGLRGGK